MSTESLDFPIVTTTTGSVQGKRTETIYGYTYTYFDGIPYAKPPLGVLRFLESEPISKWSNVKDCTHSRSKCLQWNRRINVVQGSEDCLYLNVSVKNFNTDSKLPVMVYIHGGGFNTGDPSRHAWGPDYFMMKDVVFITVGYRLGLLGFASFSDQTLGVPGNCGLKDIILALEWIQANCANFNGDPNNITLFGHSSGSTSVHMIMQAHRSKGLFHKAVLMAGYNVTLPSEPRLEYRLAKHLGFVGKEDDELAIYEFLCQCDLSNFVNFDIFTDEEKQQFSTIQIFPIMPCLESYKSDNIIISQDPITAQRNTWSNDIPLMMGSTSSESISVTKQYRDSEDEFENLKKNLRLMLPSNLWSIEDETCVAEMAKRIKELHFGDKELCSKNYQSAVEMFSYNMMYHNQHRLMQSRRKYAREPTFVYRFDFDSPTYNFYRIRYCGPEIRGAGHVDELCYMFKLPDSYKLEIDSPEYKCILQMIDIFYSFAKSSNPSTEYATIEAIEKDGVPKCLNISNEGVRVIDLPEYKKCCVRDEILEMAGIELY